jgi:hypothetical protein
MYSDIIVIVQKELSLLQEKCNELIFQFTSIKVSYFARYQHHKVTLN